MIQGHLGEGGVGLSIMIPTYNSARWLEEALASLARQGVDRAQIEVVDDCSTSDDPEEVVSRFGDSRVGLWRQPSKLGPVGNLNSCLGRAERRWVHLVRGDELVLPGAYAELAGVLERHPESRAVFARSVITDEAGIWEGLSAVLGPALSGDLVHDPARWAQSPVHSVATIFRRDAALTVGGFDDRHAHTAEWELWWKLAQGFPTAYTNACLGSHRRLGGGHGGAPFRTVAGLREGLRLVEQIAGSDPHAGPQLFASLFELAADQALPGGGGVLIARLRLLASFPSGLPRARTMAKVAGSWAVGHLSRR